jgi:hypothetical protein
MKSFFPVVTAFALVLSGLVATMPAASAATQYCFCRYKENPATDNYCSGEGFLLSSGEVPGSQLAAASVACNTRCLDLGSKISGGTLSDSTGGFCDLQGSKCDKTGSIVGSCNFCFCKYPATYTTAACRGKSVHMKPMWGNSGTKEQRCTALCAASGLEYLVVANKFTDQCDIKAGACDKASPECGGGGITHGTGAAYKPLTGSSVISLPLPGSDISPATVIGRVIKQILGIVGSLAFLMFVYGGFTWMTAGGNEERIKTARETIVWATLGLIAIFMAYGIVSYLITSIN